MKTSPYKVKFVAEALEDIEKAITRSDFRGLIAVKKVVKDKSNYSSRSGARRIAVQKRKGRKRGRGNKKGTQYSVVSRKGKWMSRIRAQRKFLKQLRDKHLISIHNYHLLYSKSKGGYFRNKRHIKLYLKEQHMIIGRKE